MRHKRTISCIWAILFATAACQTTAPRVAPAHEVVGTYHGIRVEDPYRDLENVDDPKVIQWAQGQGQFTRQALDALPGFASLKKRVNELDAMASATVSWIRRVADGRIFYLKRTSADPIGILFVRNQSGKETRLFDPQVLNTETGVTHAINNISVAPDGGHIAMVIAAHDGEMGSMYVLNVADNKMVGEPIPHLWGEQAAYWLPDSKNFVFMKRANPARTFGENQLVLRRLGSKGDDDQLLLGWNVPGAIQVRENDWLNLGVTSASPYVLEGSNEGVNGVARLFVLPRSELGTPHAKWRAVIDEKDQVRSAEHSGNWLYLRSSAGASRYRILRLDLSLPLAKPTEVVPQQEGVIEDMAAAKDGLYYVVRTGSESELFAKPHDANSKKAQKIVFPHNGTIRLANVDPALDGVLVSVEPWTESLQLYRASIGKLQAVNTGLVEASPQGGYSEIEAIETSCPTPDGVRVPLSILKKKSLVLDGKNPTILLGYGAYGYTITPSFVPARLAWLERGGIIAIANPRGSGAFGEDWYQAGVGATKPNTWKDMVACAELLIKDRYTSAPKLGLRGFSMGGLLAGRTMTERPDLFSAVTLEVGVLDAVRFIEVSPNGPNHLLEMGDVKSASGIKQLLAMSSYHHVLPGEKYPAVLVTAGLHDNRVAPWMSFKMAAKLQAATGSDKPILLRIEEEGGHGISSTAAQRTALTTDIFVFNFWQMGDPQFQPGAGPMAGHP